MAEEIIRFVGSPYVLVSSAEDDGFRVLKGIKIWDIIHNPDGRFLEAWKSSWKYGENMPSSDLVLVESGLDVLVHRTAYSPPSLEVIRGARRVAEFNMSNHVCVGPAEMPGLIQVEWKGIQYTKMEVDIYRLASVATSRT